VKDSDKTDADLHLRLPKDLLEGAKAAAKEEDMTVSQWFRRLIRKALDRRKK
jgi:predicted HicB family RNase H-like nuclease